VNNERIKNNQPVEKEQMLSLEASKQPKQNSKITKMAYQMKEK